MTPTERPGAWLVSDIHVDELSPVNIYRGDWPGRDELWTDLDAHGIQNPLIAFACPFPEWLRRMRHHVVTEEVKPPAWQAITGWVWATKRGNQRLAWARARGVTHVPAILCADEATADDLYRELGQADAES